MSCDETLENAPISPTTFRVMSNARTVKDAHGYISKRVGMMPTFVIERDLPGADKLTAEELKGISMKSNEVVAGLRVPYKWITSYVAGDKIYCVHEAESADVVRRHAKQGGFPANKVTEVAAVIDPQTAKA